MTEQGSLGRLVTLLPSVIGELRRHTESVRPIALSGSPPLVAELKTLLTRGGRRDVVGSVAIADLGRPELAQAAAVVYAMGGELTAADENALRRADRHGAPLLCVLVAERPPDRVLPYVRATDVVVAPTLEAAVGPLAARLARRCPDDAWGLAAQLPVLRDAVIAELVRRTARRNALLAASTFVPGADLPVMTLNQVRMLARVLAAAEMPPSTAVPAALLGATGAALVFRALARALRARSSLPAWAVDAAIGYAGTRVLGEAARRRSG